MKHDIDSSEYDFSNESRHMSGESSSPKIARLSLAGNLSAVKGWKASTKVVVVLLVLTWLAAVWTGISEYGVIY